MPKSIPSCLPGPSSVRKVNCSCPHIRVGKNANQAVAKETPTTVDWQTTVAAQDLTFDFDLDAFVAPASGVYSITTNLTYEAELARVGLRALAIAVNTELQNVITVRANDFVGPVYVFSSATLFLKKGDIVSIEAVHSAEEETLDILPTGPNVTTYLEIAQLC